jgi:hypothetical protein
MKMPSLTIAYAHASGEDDADLTLPFAVRVSNPVPTSGHSKRALLDDFW